jgi:hypothetical protein
MSLSKKEALARQVLRVHAVRLVFRVPQAFKVPAASALLAQPALQGLRELVAQLACKVQAVLVSLVQQVLLA